MAAQDLNLPSTDDYVTDVLVTATASGNTVAPVISNFVPAVGTGIGRQEVIQFDVTDDEGLFRRIILMVEYEGSDIKEIIHDSENFNGNYSGVSNTRTAITNGYRFTVLRDGGWPAAPTITPFAIDEVGNEAV